MNKYAIFVNDPAGWQNDCPDYKTVFFGYEKDGWDEYVHPVNAGIHPCGHIIVTGYRNALVMLRKLRTSGDWVVYRGEPEKHEERPSYGMQIWE